MFPLFELMNQAQNGKGMEALAQQFGLAQDQAAKAMAALMPAFSVGLQKNASNPMDFASLMTSLSSGNYAKYFENLNAAFTPQGINDGNSLLGQIFGSKDVSRAVAAEAAKMTGIGQDILKQMLPGMANAVMGGLFAQTASQMQNFASANPMSGMINQWLETMGMVPKPKSPTDALFDNPFAQSMLAMFNAQPSVSSNAFTDNPFAKMMQALMPGAPAPAASAASEPAPEKSAAAVNPMGDFLQSMFDSGLEVQKNYQKSLESIFETSTKA